jgi:uncharacterized protein (TIGR00369 family)
MSRAGTACISEVCDGNLQPTENISDYRDRDSESRGGALIPDEPVRGRTPPPWFRALTGIERVRAFSRGLLPWPPMARLLGTRTTHVAAGTVTIAMPASDACIGGTGQLVISPLMMVALDSASFTALPGGFDLVPLRFTMDPFRPAWPRRGNLLARARVVNSGNIYVFAEVQVEDPDGRHLAQGSLRSEIRKVVPEPPAPPETMEPVDEPAYTTPDPYLRSFPTGPLAEIIEREDGVTTLRRFVDGSLSMPVATLYGVRYEHVADGRLALSIPASEWFCAVDGDVSWYAIGALADMAGMSLARSFHRPGSSIVALDSATRFFRPVRPDGRRLHAEATAGELAGNIVVAEVRICDADGQLVATFSGTAARIDAARRAGRRRTESRRMLATLLFTDIVESTGHAERLGDAAWRSLLEQHNLLVRREASRYNGIEVTTTGDGFVIRFDSPVYAIGAARAARLAAATLGLDIRAGIHAGECEVEGDRLTGMAVHIAARIQAAAAPGEILVSSTVKDLAVGSTIRFTDRGERNLKGVPDVWRLFAIAE